MKTVYEANNSLEGHMVANLLEQANIFARVDGDFLQGGVGELQPMGIVRVMVNNEDFDQAREMVIQWESTQPKSDNVQSAKGYTWLHLLMSFMLGVAVGAALIYDSIGG